MKRNLATILSILFFFGYIYSNFKKQTPKSDFDFDTLGKVPVIMNGRVQPLDSVAKNSLLAMNGKRSAVYQDGTKHHAIEWLAEAIFEPSAAFDRPVFRIHDDGLRAILPHKTPEQRDSAIMAALFGSGSSHHYYSFNEIRGSFEKIRRDAMEASQIESELRTRYQKAVVNLANNAIQFYNLTRTIHHGETPSYLDELAAMQTIAPKAVAETEKQQRGEAFDSESLQGMLGFIQLYRGFGENAAFFTHPAEPVDGQPNWDKMSVVLDEVTRDGAPSKISKNYATLTDAYRQDDVATFNQAAAELLAALDAEDAKAFSKAKAEHQFNYLSPFYVSIVGYVFVFLLAVFSWPFSSRGLNRAAFWTLIAVFAIHTIGMGYRVYIIGYAPVINLYSSAIYVGWGATLLSLIIERLYRNGIGSFIAAVIGIASLIVAHHLIDGRDTLEQMKAVLDSNFWLTVHVLTITFGYASTFFSGFIGIFWVLAGLTTKLIDKQRSKMLASVVYGIICFSTLFSFFGTVSGGIWADQSWGRFWGWDPKENGAILLVLWNVIILHSRWGGFAKTRGIMAMAIFGNVVTSWSWMGTNMLGIGLHSYGFMNSAFHYLLAFWLTQLAVIALAYIPAKNWKSEIRV
ncbi:cytochrome c biogenesis protein [Pelagicoccus mobilis]|uniref:Cytochrome c biogenesis protein CcsA n=1 Tax=Pelagicoccus mobilis TaxID=415221 RepID=A0A934RZW7_9BACT|nr:cytochrome c biogenesis protein CcsA [Pelagicoccus mobilis]MBK1876543.1 cytochrome c biogenesis protein CcsA [Pelagicoccus mobilis]